MNKGEDLHNQDKIKIEAGSHEKIYSCVKNIEHSDLRHFPNMTL